jgi:hypothetical protein
VRKTFEVVEHLRMQGCVGETQLQTESLRSSVELCQVGIEQVRCSAQWKKSVES